ncbi:MAG: flagellar hook capping FlgD N-terminal domain-containing protein [Arcobacteraceae bacterium]|jgi:flagellar basal-body rod modification protein FlgD|nr:flagellar hook capping FlgD N-terminal domain-containing protein [Arcobacteraceae bacterium]
MAVENVQTSTSTDAYGNAYTTALSNDKLTNDDFLKLMLTELQMQDPTKPMDSQNMLQSQMQMSAIETNLQTIETMKSLQQSFAQTALSQSANMIGHVVENGEYGDNGEYKEFLISAVESIDGEIMLHAYQVLGYDETTEKTIISDTKELLNLNKVTKIN